MMADSTTPANSRSEAHRSGAEYQVVARRYRPQSFGELVGQSNVSQALCNAIATDRVGHAYLFTGARGVGKTSTARILAKSLNCVRGPTATPCGECDICLQIASGEDVDVLEIDGASNRGIDEIRQLRSNVSIRPSRARFKIYIIDEVHMLTKEAFNALLKTLEEPPDHVKFVFCTTEANKIPITVLSRCQRFDFSPVRTTEIADRLRYIVEREGAEAEPGALELLARRAAGSMRDSQSLLEQLLSFVSEPLTVAHVHKLLGTARDDRLHTLVEALVQRNAALALQRLDETLLEGVDAGQLGEQLLGCLRDMMVACVGGAPEILLHHAPSAHDDLRAVAATWGLQSLLAAAQILDQSLTRMRFSIHPRILLELALVRIAELEHLDSLTGLLGQLARGESLAISTANPANTGGAPAATRQVSMPSSADSMPSLRDSVEEAKKKRPAAETNSVTSAPRTPQHNGDSAPQRVTPATPTPTPTPITPAVAPPRTTTATTATPASRSAPSPSPPPGRIDDPSEATMIDEEVEPELAAMPVAPSTDASANSLLRLDTAHVLRAWRVTLDALNDMTADHAGLAESVSVGGPHRLVIRYKQVYNSSKTYCERPEKRALLERSLSEQLGGPIHLDFELLRDAPVAEARRTQPAVARSQIRQQVMRHPLVQRAMELFEAEVTNVDRQSE